MQNFSSEIPGNIPGISELI